MYYLPVIVTANMQNKLYIFVVVNKELNFSLTIWRQSSTLNLAISISDDLDDARSQHDLQPEEVRDPEKYIR